MVPPPAPAALATAPSDKREKLEKGTHINRTDLFGPLTNLAGEAVLMPGSGPKPYVLQRKEKVYMCSCSIWRNIDDIEQRRTCKHLRQLRGEKAETGRVGEEGIRKSDEKLKELLEADQRIRQMQASQPAQVAGPAASALGKRPMEAEQDRVGAKKPHPP